MMTVEVLKIPLISVYMQFILRFGLSGFEQKNVQKGGIPKASIYLRNEAPRNNPKAPIPENEAPTINPKAPIPEK